jgi:hypothetical protein
MDTQNLIIDTLVGPKQIPAPTPWSFGKTDTIVWSRLLQATYLKIQLGDAAGGPRVIKREHARYTGQIEALSAVLADSQGMAAFYWENAAWELCKEGKY